jgi:thiamine-phosphate pyrophosphorylase
MTQINREKLRQFLKVYFIMGSVNCRKNPLQVLQEAIEGGITLFQFREKGKGALTGVAKFQLAQQLQKICQKNGVPFIVNDDIDLAIALDADGVHIGQEDETAEIVRERIGKHKILGVSVHTIEEAQKAVRDGADYLGLGPIFPTQTKEDAKAVQGTNLIVALRNLGMDIPIVGIGGITPENAKSVISAGADGVSVITAITHAPSITDAAALLRRQTLPKV